MKPRTPLEAFMQIAQEHAADTLAATEKQRAARLADRLESYGQALGEVAEQNGGQATSNCEERQR